MQNAEKMGTQTEKSIVSIVEKNDEDGKEWPGWKRMFRMERTAWMEKYSQDGTGWLGWKRMAEMEKNGWAGKEWLEWKIITKNGKGWERMGKMEKNGQGGKGRLEWKRTIKMENNGNGKNGHNGKGWLGWKRKARMNKMTRIGQKCGQTDQSLMAFSNILNQNNRYGTGTT